MADCMRTLNESGLREAVERAARAKPLLGVCVGEQMLFDRSEEGDTPCLGIFRRGASLRRPALRARRHGRGRGLRVRRRQAGAAPTGAELLKVPHMGWNKVRQTRSHPVWAGIPDETHFYFVHSYYADPADPGLTVGETDYGVSFTCAVAAANIFAVQFHRKRAPNTVCACIAIL